MNNLAGMLFQVEQIEAQVTSKLAGLKDRRIEAVSDDGLVAATVDIWFNVRSVTVNRDLVSRKTYDLAVLENSICQAVNNAITKARGVLKEELGAVLGGRIPPQFSGFFGRGGGDEQG